MWDSDCFKEFEGCGAVPAPFGKSIQLRPVVKLPGFLKPRPAQLQVMEGRVLEAAAILEAQLEKMDKYMNIMSPALAPVLQDLAATYGLCVRAPVPPVVCRRLSLCLTPAAKASIPTCLPCPPPPPEFCLTTQHLLGGV